MTRGSTIERGAAAEAAAARYLQAQGLSVLARNLRCRVGELDLVCLDDDVIGSSKCVIAQLSASAARSHR